MSRSSEGVKCAKEAAEQERCVIGRDERIFEQEGSGNGYTIETSELVRLLRLLCFVDLWKCLLRCFFQSKIGLIRFGSYVSQ